MSQDLPMVPWLKYPHDEPISIDRAYSVNHPAWREWANKQNVFDLSPHNRALLWLCNLGDCSDCLAAMPEFPTSGPAPLDTPDLGATMISISDNLGTKMLLAMPAFRVYCASCNTEATLDLRVGFDISESAVTANANPKYTEDENLDMFFDCVAWGESLLKVSGTAWHVTLPGWGTSCAFAWCGNSECFDNTMHSYPYAEPSRHFDFCPPEIVQG